MWADVSAALAGYRYPYQKLKENQKADLDHEATLTVYVRSTKPQLLPQLPWLELTSLETTKQAVQLAGTLRRRDLLKHQIQFEDAGAFVVQVPDNLDLDQVLKASVAVAEALV